MKNASGLNHAECLAILTDLVNEFETSRGSIEGELEGLFKEFKEKFRKSEKYQQIVHEIDVEKYFREKVKELQYFTKKSSRHIMTPLQFQLSSVLEREKNRDHFIRLLEEKLKDTIKRETRWKDVNKEISKHDECAAIENPEEREKIFETFKHTFLEKQKQQQLKEYEKQHEILESSKRMHNHQLKTAILDFKTLLEEKVKDVAINYETVRQILISDSRFNNPVLHEDTKRTLLDEFLAAKLEVIPNENISSLTFASF